MVDDIANSDIDVQQKIEAADYGEYLITNRDVQMMSVDDVMALQLSLHKLLVDNPNHDLEIHDVPKGILVKWRKRHE